MMRLKDRVQGELQRAAARGGGILRLDTDVGQLECQLVAADALSCAFESFLLQTDRLADATMERLKQVCDALAARLIYLLEPIAVIESDDEHRVIQMRSRPPHKDAHATSYYELVVRRGGQLRLCRYEKLPGSQRRVVPAHVTHEVFCRLAEDFTAVVS